jgi:hypothetical protein
MKPTWELHDLQGNVEHDLFENYITEFNDIAGIKIDYYIRDRGLKADYFYGESTRTRFLGPFRTKVLYEPTPEETLTTGFGINSDEVISFASIPKFTLTRDVSAGYHPVPGDALITIWNNRAYEIADVAEESKIFQLKKMIWEFVLRPYRFSEQSETSRDISRFTRLPTDPNLTDTMTTPLTAFGDNEEIEKDSNADYNYPSQDTKIYGY